MVMALGFWAVTLMGMLIAREIIKWKGGRPENVRLKLASGRVIPLNTRYHGYRYQKKRLIRVYSISVVVDDQAEIDSIQCGYLPGGSEILLQVFLASDSKLKKASN